MRRIVNPQQTRLFDSFNPVLTDQTQRLLLDDWPGVFRHVILELMPAEQLGGHLHATMGRPSKELYSMAGLLLLMEIMDWTKQEAMYEYYFNMAVHYALNLEPVAQDLSVRTLERYMLRFEQEELASKVMHDVSVHLIKLLDIKIDQQRLDSTHVFSNMASYGRTRLMGVAIKRFLTQLKRHDPKAYELLDEPLRTRYAPGVNQLFGAIGKDNESRRLLGPLFRKIQTRIHQAMLLTRSIAHVDSHLPIVHFAESSQPLTLHTHRIVATLFVGRWIKDNYTVILTKFSANLPGQFFQQWLMIPRCKTYEPLQCSAILIVAVGNRLNIFSSQIRQQSGDIDLSILLWLTPAQRSYEGLSKLFQTFEHTVGHLLLDISFLKNLAFSYFKSSLHRFAFPWGLAVDGLDAMVGLTGDLIGTLAFNITFATNNPFV